MSLRAMLWALHDAPVDDPTATLVLIGLADHASDDGAAAWPSRASLARYARCSIDTVDRRIALLLELEVITQGDQRLVAHLRGDRRPVVYDLLLTPSRTGPQVAAPRADGAAGPGSRGRNTPENGAAAVRHRTVPRTVQNQRPPAPDGGGAMPWCRRCSDQHPIAEVCVTSRDKRPAPRDLRAMVEAAAAASEPE